MITNTKVLLIMIQSKEEVFFYSIQIQWLNYLRKGRIFSERKIASSVYISFSENWFPQHHLFQEQEDNMIEQEKRWVKTCFPAFILFSSLMGKLMKPISIMDVNNCTYIALWRIVTEMCCRQQWNCQTISYPFIIASFILRIGRCMEVISIFAWVVNYKL